MAYDEKNSTSARDTQDHYGVIILGAGLSGLAANIQLKRKLGFTDVICYEKSGDVGGTWNYNRYPGAACDIPMALYSYSFAPPNDVPHQWAEQPIILDYLHSVRDKYKVDNIAYRHLVSTSSFSRKTGLWTVKVTDLDTNQEKTRTCNILITAVGGLATPNDPPFNVEDFNGKVFHTARWDHSVDIKGKNVILVGNGCTAAQIVPEIVNQVGSLTQIARSRQAIVRRPLAPDSAAVHWCRKWIPGFAFILRAAIFFMMERMFTLTDIIKGEKSRKHVVDDTVKYIQEKAPKKYWDVLVPDFDLAAKRRIFDSGYYEALNNSNMELVVGDTVENVKGDYVYTKQGKKLKADIIVLATGFQVHNYLFPLKVYNEDTGKQMKDVFKQTNVAMFRGTVISDFPNLFVLQGPNTATGHSSVIFTSECQITMMLKLVKPILEQLKTAKIAQSPAPTVEVTQHAQDRYMDSLRKEMKKKVWEKDGGVSWYVDRQTGFCTTLYPWSQINYWWNSLNLNRADFKRT